MRNDANMSLEVCSNDVKDYAIWECLCPMFVKTIIHLHTDIKCYGVIGKVLIILKPSIKCVSFIK